MHVTRSRFLSVPALAALLAATLGVFASPAAAQDGMRIARACVMQIQDATEEAVESQNQVTRRTIAAIRDAAADGSPDRVIRAIAQNGLDRVQAIGARSDAAIEELAKECLQRLRELEAHHSLLHAVRAAAAQSDEQLEDSTRRTSRAIRGALARALD